MSEEWTIDTWVLYLAADVDWEAIEFLNHIKNNRDRVVFDHEGLIKDQYERCIRKSKRDRRSGCLALEQWFINIVGKYARLYSSSLQPTHRKGLNELGFHDDDWPFVSVCSKSKSKRLVAEESDYKPIVKDYLRNAMSVDVFSLQEAKALALSQLGQ